MRLFTYQLNQTFKRHAEYKVYYCGSYIGTITVWKDGYVGYSADSVIENLGLMKRAAEEYKTIIRAA